MKKNRKSSNSSHSEKEIKSKIKEFGYDLKQA